MANIEWLGIDATNSATFLESGTVDQKLSKSLDNYAKSYSTTGGTEVRVGCEAIPSGDANVRYLDAKLQGNTADHSTDQAVLAWRGIFAILGLSRYVGFNLTAVNVNFDVPSNKTDVCAGYYDHLRGCSIGQDSGELCVTYILKDGKPIAFSHKELGWVPMANIDRRVLEDVPWYDNAEGEWLPIQKLPRGTTGEIKDIHCKRLKLWLDEISLARSKCPISIAMALGAYSSDIVASFNDFTVTNIKTTKMGNALDSGSELISSVFHSVTVKVPDMDTPPVTDSVFSEYIMVTDRGTLGVPRDTFKLSFSGQADEAYSALLPFSREGVEYFTKYRDKVKIDKLSVELSTYINKPEEGLRVILCYTRDGISSSKEHVYRTHEILYRARSFPFFSLWPYRRFTYNDEPNCWKRYYLTVSEGESAGASRNPFDRQNVNSADEGDCNSFSLDMIDPKKDLFTVSSSNTDHSLKWRLARFSEFPEYIHLVYTSNEQTYDVGCVYVTPPEQIALEHDKVVSAAIDFGTTNTIVAAAVRRGEAGEYSMLENKRIIDPDDLLVLQKEYVRSKGIIDEFHKYYWMNDEREVLTAPSGKMRSIVQKYTTTPKLNHPHALESGRIIPADGKTISYFDMLSDGDLPSCGIKGNIKLSSYDADARWFIENLVVNTALMAMKQGAGRLELSFSYPDSTNKQNQSFFWNSACNLLTEEFIKINNFLVESAGKKYRTMRESSAAANHVMLTADATIAGDVGFSVADIGGGTCDISIHSCTPSRSETSGIYSLHYAGDSLLSASVYSVLKKFPDIGHTIWKAPVSDSERMVFNVLTGQNSSLSKLLNEDIGTDISKYSKTMNAVATSVNALMETASIDTEYMDETMAGGWSPSKMLFSLVRAKVTAIFYVLAKMLRSLDESRAPKFYGVPFPIALAGGGAKACGLCGEEFINGFICNNVLKSEIGNDKASFKITVPDASMNKIEVADGMLRKTLSTPAGIPLESDEVTGAESDGEFSLRQDTIERISELFREFVGK